VPPKDGAAERTEELPEAARGADPGATVIV
jgi:hypothetical protein